MCSQHKCSAMHTLRDECVANPCLSIAGECSRGPFFAPEGTDCSQWCCHVDFLALGGTLLACVVFCVTAIVCGVCCYRRWRSAQYEFAFRNMCDDGATRPHECQELQVRHTANTGRPPLAPQGPTYYYHAGPPPSAWGHAQRTDYLEVVPQTPVSVVVSSPASSKGHCTSTSFSAVVVSSPSTTSTPTGTPVVE